MADDAATVELLRGELRELCELRAADHAEIAALRNEKDGLAKEVGRLRSALTEVLEQQTATAEVLWVITSAPTNLQRVPTNAATTPPGPTRSPFPATGLEVELARSPLPLHARGKIRHPILNGAAVKGLAQLV